MSQHPIYAAVCIEREHIEEKYPWAHTVGAYAGSPPAGDALHPHREDEFMRHIRLWEDTPAIEIGTVVAQLCAYNGVEPEQYPGRVIAALLAEESLTIAGGLVFRRGGEVLLRPGCCCGLETWRGWRHLLEGGESPWLGHDPWPSAAPAGPEHFLLKADQKDAGFTLTRRELEAIVAAAERDLRRFVHRLRDWASAVAPRRAWELASAVSRHLKIGEVLEPPAGAGRPR
jgi:hypothetical protein